MDTQEALVLAETLLKEHGLHYWHVKLDKAKKRFGRCTYYDTTISLSRALVAVNTIETVKETILHEIAHALVGSGHGHGRVWRDMAYRIGANGKARYGGEVAVPRKTIKGTCPKCLREIFRYRRMSLACSKCCGGRFNTDYLFKWERI